MLGLAYIFIFLVYLLISVGVIAFVIRKAKERGIAGWKWGVPAAIVMYLIMFWDHIPTEIAHSYYCHKDARFKVYKTLEQWKKENPGVADTLKYQEFPDSEGDRNRYIRHLNQRFNSIFTRTPVFLSVKRLRHQIIDTSNNEVIAEYVDYSSGGSFHNANLLIDFKLWLANDTCEKDMKENLSFYDIQSKVTNIGDE